MEKKYVIFKPGGDYPFPEPEISKTFIAPLSRKEIFDLYCGATFNLYEMGGEDDPSEGMYGPAFSDWAYSEIYSATFIIEGLDDKTIEDIPGYIDSPDYISIDELVEHVEKNFNGGEIEYIKFPGLDNPDRDAKTIQDSTFTYISEPRIMDTEMVIQMYLNAFHSIDKSSKDKFKKALILRGDIDLNLIDGLDSMARVRKRNK